MSSLVCVAVPTVLLIVACSGPRSPAGDGPSRPELSLPDRGPRDADPCATPIAPQPGTLISDRGALIGLSAGATWAFKGVPFAAPPTGPLRFKPPVPPPCWNDERPATAFGQRCPQLDETGAVSGSEDCLTLNLWTPKSAAPGAKLPVLFFLHGGGNIQGSPAEKGKDGAFLYDGQALAEKANAVVVTTNYRLGALSWLVHPALVAEGSPGNLGLLDQLAAARRGKSCGRRPRRRASPSIATTSPTRCKTAGWC